MMTPCIDVLRQYANTYNCHDNGKYGAETAGLVVKGHHDNGGDNGVHKVKRGSHAARHVIVAINQEERRAVADERKVNECDQFAAAYFETFALHQHDGCYDEAGKAKAVEQDCRVGHEIGLCATLDGERKEGNKTIAHGCKQT